MKTYKTLIITTFLFISFFCSGQITVDTNGNTILGNFETLGKGISVIDSCTSSAAVVPLKIVRSPVNKVFFRRNDPNRGMYINRNGMLRVGTRINGSDYESDGNTPLSIVSDASQAIDLYLVNDGTYGIRIWHTGLYNDIISAFHQSRLNFQISGSGNVYARGSYNTSDISMKKDVETISGPLAKVMQLRGVVYHMNSPETVERKQLVSLKDSYTLLNKQKPGLSFATFQQMEKEKSFQRMGVVAQEVEKIVPEVVRTQEDGLKAVAYQELIGLLIEAMKEQQGMIDQLTREVAELKNRPAVMKSSETTKAVTGIDTPLSASVLSQNAPNPFTEQTEIRYFLTENAKDAFIGIFDMQGTLILKEAASAGNNSVMIAGSRLAVGMYMYSLIAGGEILDTKQMVLTK